MRSIFGVGLAAVLALTAGCGAGGDGRPRELAAFALDQLDEIVEPADETILMDRENSADGRGSLRVDAKRARIVRLFEVPLADLPGREIVCTMRMKSLVMRGPAFPELWASGGGRDPISVRDERGGVAHSMDWRDVSVSLVLEEGWKPDRIRVNLVMTGAGRVWVDDVRLTAGKPGAGSAPGGS